MADKIKEELEKYYNNLTIEVEYIKIKTYKIIINTNILNNRNVKNITFYIIYKWDDKMTTSANIEQIKYQIDKNLKKAGIDLGKLGEILKVKKEDED